MTGTTSGGILDAWAAANGHAGGFSLSRLGGCRRQARYLLDGVAPSDPERDPGSGRQAAIGSALHKVIAEHHRETAPEGDLVEYAVSLLGIPGTLDRYHADTCEVADTKTVYNRIAKVRREGPSRQDRWQAHAYGAALVLAGLPVRTVRIDYLDRATGEEFSVVEKFNPSLVRDALQWLDEVRSTPLEWAPRDFLPTSARCRGCPFATDCWQGGVPGRRAESVLYVEHPDAAEWGRTLEIARRAESDAKAEKNRARFALDAIRPDEPGTVVVDGVPFRWTRVKGRHKYLMQEIADLLGCDLDGLPHEVGEPSWRVTADVDLRDVLPPPIDLLDDDTDDEDADG